MTTKKQHALLQFKSQCNPVIVIAAVKMVKCRFCRLHGSPAVTFLAHRPVWPPPRHSTPLIQRKALWVFVVLPLLSLALFVH